MLIKSLDARNFRKYNKLIIKDIPESGVITVEGSNESGKTSIGEAICFALFGRTFFLEESDLPKVVCWGSDDAEVTITFVSGDGDNYTLWRSVNRSGEISAKLAKSQESVDINDDQSAISDPEKISHALTKILGFDFDAFSNSFYLAQRELTSPHPQSHTIKQMAGIASYAKINDDLEQDSQRLNETIEELTPQVETNQTKLAELDMDETWLPELVNAEDILGKEQKGREQLVGRLDDDAPLYSSNFASFHAAKKSSGLFGLLSKLFFPISILLWLLWFVYTYNQDDSIAFLLENFAENSVATITNIAEKWLLPSAVISSLIAIFSFFMNKKAKTKMQHLNSEAKIFSGVLDGGHGYVTTLAESLLPERIVQLLHERQDESTTLQVLPAREEFNDLTKLISDSVSYKADPEEMATATKRLSEELKRQDAEVANLSDTILDDIREEKARVDQAENYKTTIVNLNKVIDKSHYSIETHTIASGIMQRAAKDSVDKFNRNISEVSEKTLPNFTQDRYSKMRIAEDFSVQIYSDSKKDYMDFDEISSGTQRQVMLALRIAMSEQLSMNTGNEEQFIFLDEPFAFFDQPRTKATLNALPSVSDVISQIWISAQEFPNGINVAKRIECPSDESELIV